MSALLIMNQKYLSYKVLRAENSLETTKFRPIESKKNNSIKYHNCQYSSKKRKSSCKIIFEMKMRQGPGEESYSDHIFPKNGPAKTRSKFSRLLKGKNPDKDPAYSARKSRPDNPPEIQEDIICDNIERNSCQKNKHFCLWSSTC